MSACACSRRETPTAPHVPRTRDRSARGARDPARHHVRALPAERSREQDQGRRPHARDTRGGQPRARRDGRRRLPSRASRRATRKAPEGASSSSIAGARPFSIRPRERGASFASRPEIASALRGAAASGTRHSSTLGTDLLYVAVPVASSGAVHGAVRVTYPTSALSHRVQRYWLLLAAIAGVTLAAVTIAGGRLSRTVTTPLSAVESAAEAVGE